MLITVQLSIQYMYDDDDHKRGNRLQMSFSLTIRPVEAGGGGAVHEVGYPASPAVPLAGVEPPAVRGVRHQVAPRVPRHPRADLVID